MQTTTTFELSAHHTKAILLDIEGTTTPISFVYDVLFPFARSHLRSFLEQEFHSAAVQSDLELLKREHEAEQVLSAPQLDPSSIMSIVSYVEWLMDQDRKSTALKSLQGKIWEEGYRTGILRSKVFPDVAPAFKRWRAGGLKVAIFSSGSILAQKLLFRHTEHGDLTHFIAKYFDTTTGPKSEVQSYAKIAAALKFKATDVLFVSDVVAELDAAGESGMNTLLSVRPGNHPAPSDNKHTTIKTFNEIPP